MGDRKKIAVIGGGTVSHVRSHLALAAPAYGTTARELARLCGREIPEMATCLHLTHMAGGERYMSQEDGRTVHKYLETNDDVAALVERLVKDTSVKIIFFNPAMVDWQGNVFDGPYEESATGSGSSRSPVAKPGKYSPRLSTRLEVEEDYSDAPDWVQEFKSQVPDEQSYFMRLTPTEKVVRRIRKNRKDIFLVAFKQTCGATEDEQYIAGLNLCKEASVNLVLANDTKTRLNMVITPEEARYHVTTDREEALTGLVRMAKLRSHLTFTRSTVVSGESVKWDSDLVPASLRRVVDHCIERGAYKPFRGSTVGHFAVKLNDNTFLTSQRRTNFNDLAKIGLVKVVTDGPDTVLAYGAKPSVGGQSQRLVFTDHPGLDCIVHFHCPIKEGSVVPVRSQYEFECGSHECGKNTSDGLQQFGNLKAVYLDEHGPNIVFNRNIDPQEVIDFIDVNFDLSQKTGGYVSIKQRLETPNTLDTARKVID